MGDNLVLIHAHDLGRHLGCYGNPGVTSPHLDDMAESGWQFLDAHSTAPLCSPSRGSLFTGKYPHNNGLSGLAHHGFSYFPGTQTLPGVLGNFGYDTALFGMQHETSGDPGSLGYGEHDVSKDRCGVVAQRSVEWLDRREQSGAPFMLVSGFFEIHRPYDSPAYPTLPVTLESLPNFLDDSPQLRNDMGRLLGSIATMDAAAGKIIAAARSIPRTWIVFLTDHGLAMPRAKSSLHGAGTEIALLILPPREARAAPMRHSELFSGVDLMPTILDLIGMGETVPDDCDGYSHAPDILSVSEVSRSENRAIFGEKMWHDTYDPIRSVRTQDFLYIEHFGEADRIALSKDVAASETASGVDPTLLERRRVELYDLRRDPLERSNVVDDPTYASTVQHLASVLEDWRRRTHDHIPGQQEGDHILRQMRGNR